MLPLGGGLPKAVSAIHQLVLPTESTGTVSCIFVSWYSIGWFACIFVPKICVHNRGRAVAFGGSRISSFSNCHKYQTSTFAGDRVDELLASTQCREGISATITCVTRGRRAVGACRSVYDDYYLQSSAAIVTPNGTNEIPAAKQAHTIHGPKNWGRGEA